MFTFFLMQLFLFVMILNLIFPSINKNSKKWARLDLFYLYVP